MKNIRIIALITLIIVAVGVIFNTQTCRNKLHSIESKLNILEAALEERYAEKHPVTINEKLESYAIKRMSEISAKGSTIVLENETGAVRTLLTYDNVSGTISENWKGSVTPGKLFTVISAIPIAEKGLAKTEVNDTGSINLKENIVVNNSANCSYENEDMRTAFINGSKVWFACLYDQKLNADDFRQIAERALIGKYKLLDFAFLKSSCDMSSYEKTIGSILGYNISVSPIQLAAWYSGICNGSGKVMKPHIQCTDSKAFTELTDSSTAYQIRDCLIATGEQKHCENTCVIENCLNSDEPTLTLCGNSKYTVLCAFSGEISSEKRIDVANKILIYAENYCGS